MHPRTVVFDMFVNGLMATFATGGISFGSAACRRSVPAWRRPESQDSRKLAALYSELNLTPFR